jgi:hypothetical protein
MFGLVPSLKITGGRPLAQVSLPLADRHFGQTSRRDAWWVQPLLVFLGLSAFIVYATWAALQGEHYYLAKNGANYLSPFYSPELWGDSPHHWFGTRPTWWPFFVTPAFLILWIPGGFRVTCYYYRGAYYKAFWADPPNCTVGEPRKSYWGERSGPLLIQNIHRYFLYLAIVFIFLLAHDVWNAMWFTKADGTQSFGIGVGTLVLAVNVILIGGYTCGCHSLRHLVSSGFRQLSRYPVRKQAYDCVSCLNRRHMLWAWLSLFWVAFCDVYVRLCSMGVWTDWRIL